MNSKYIIFPITYLLYLVVIFNSLFFANKAFAYHLSCSIHDGYGEYFYISNPPNNSFFNPTINVEHKFCMWPCCGTENVTLNAYGQCNIFWATGFERACARYMTPSNCNQSGQDPCPGNVNQLDHNKLYICAYNDPMFPADINDFHPDLQSHPLMSSTQPIVSSSLANGVLEVGGTGVLGIGVLVAAAGAIMEALASITKHINYTVFSNEGCIEAPLAPSPPPFCPTIQKRKTLPSISKLCGYKYVGKKILKEVSKPDDICELRLEGEIGKDGNQDYQIKYNSFSSPYIRVYTNHPIKFCSSEELNSDKLCAVKKRPNIEFTNYNLTAAKKASLDAIKDAHYINFCSDADLYTKTECLVKINSSNYSTNNKPQRKLYGFPQSKQTSLWFQIPPGLRLGKSQTDLINLFNEVGINYGDYSDQSTQFAINSTSASSNKVKLNVGGGGSDGTEVNFYLYNDYTISADNTTVNNPNQLCLYLEDPTNSGSTSNMKLGCIKRPSMPMPIISKLDRAACIAYDHAGGITHIISPQLNATFTDAEYCKCLLESTSNNKVCAGKTFPRYASKNSKNIGFIDPLNGYSYLSLQVGLGEDFQSTVIDYNPQNIGNNYYHYQQQPVYLHGYPFSLYITDDLNTPLKQVRKKGVNANTSSSSSSTSTNNATNTDVDTGYLIGKYIYTDTNQNVQIGHHEEKQIRYILENYVLDGDDNALNNMTINNRPVRYLSGLEYAYNKYIRGGTKVCLLGYKSEEQMLTKKVCVMRDDNLCGQNSTSSTSQGSGGGTGSSSTSSSSNNESNNSSCCNEKKYKNCKSQNTQKESNICIQEIRKCEICSPSEYLPDRIEPPYSEGQIYIEDSYQVPTAAQKGQMTSADSVLRPKIPLEQGLCVDIAGTECAQVTTYSAEDGGAVWPSTKYGNTIEGKCIGGDAFNRNGKPPSRTCLLNGADGANVSASWGKVENPCNQMPIWFPTNPKILKNCPSLLQDISQDNWMKLYHTMPSVDVEGLTINFMQDNYFSLDFTREMAIILGKYNTLGKGDGIYPVIIERKNNELCVTANNQLNCCPNIFEQN